jgi:hypothetical protein
MAKKGKRLIYTFSQGGKTYEIFQREDQIKDFVTGLTKGGTKALTFKTSNVKGHSRTRYPGGPKIAVKGHDRRSVRGGVSSLQTLPGSSVTFEKVVGLPGFQKTVVTQITISAPFTVFLEYCRTNNGFIGDEYVLRSPDGTPYVIKRAISLPPSVV